MLSGNPLSTDNTISPIYLNRERGKEREREREREIKGGLVTFEIKRHWIHIIGRCMRVNRNVENVRFDSVCSVEKSPRKRIVGEFNYRV